MAVEATTQEGTTQKININRREFLNLAWLASLGFFMVELGGITYLFSMPRFKAGEFGGIFAFGPISQLPPAGSPPLNVPKVKLWLSNTDQGLIALYKVCTHLGCLYNWNTQEDKFICPCHGSQFQGNGDYIQGPAPRSLDRFIVEITSPDGQVVAQTDPVTGQPVAIPEDANLIVNIDTGRRIMGKRHG